jgi:SAM-dependent methyltransferase
VSQAIHPSLVGKHLYFGNLTAGERQYASGRFVGLALFPQHSQEIRHNAQEPLPVADGSVEKIQSQDVFEHLPYDGLPPVLDDIHRALKPGGIFRLSLPDYGSPFLLKRCAFDEEGHILADLRMGGSIAWDRKEKRRKVEFQSNGNAHLWFPTWELVWGLIRRSTIEHCAEIQFHHYFVNRAEYVMLDYPEDEMFVMRAPPHDRRAGGLPISLIVDFRK